MAFLERLFLRRPRILNLLHSLRLINPTSQTIPSELQTIERYAKGATLALEIGSSQGVSAARIAAAITKEGVLYCVDPWPSADGEVNASYAIFERHMRQCGVANKIHVVQKMSSELDDEIPGQFDFVFVDGDHSWAGVANDWQIVRQKLRRGGIVCLHDSIVPPEEPWREPDSVRFYREVICSDPQFETIEVVHSLAVLRRAGAAAG